jgi:hypothetical protein
MKASAIDWVKVGVAAGFGAADKAAQDSDAKNARTETFKTWSDYLRILGAVGGLGVMAFMPKHAKIAEAIALPAVAFLTQSVWKYAAGMGTASSSAVTYTPVRTTQPIKQRYPAPEYQDEFKNIRL